MMLTFTAPAPLLGIRLALELELAGFSDVQVGLTNGALEVNAARAGQDINESDRAAIQAVIDAHDGSPTEVEQRPGRVRAKLAAVVATFEDAATDKAVWDALTQAQRSEVNRRAALAVAKLIRHALNQFDSPE